MALAVPTPTCTMTAWALPETMVWPSAMATARFSCGTAMALGAAAFVVSARAMASISEGKSVPALAKR